MRNCGRAETFPPVVSSRSVSFCKCLLMPVSPPTSRRASSVAAYTQLDGAVFAAAWAEGRAMTLEQAIEYALAAEA